jgi:formylglycine-generating enzyme required for sulfatase activity
MGCSIGDSQCDAIEKPARQMIISSGFWIGQTEVTVSAYRRFAQETSRRMPPEPKWLDRSLNPKWQDLEQPIVNVTWDEGQAFCRWTGGRLPTESEWEYAARAGDISSRYGDIDSIAWYANNSGSVPFDGEATMRSDPHAYGDLLFKSGAHPHHVAQKYPNRWGLYDTIGNVWEWTDSSFPNAGQQIQANESGTSDLRTPQVLRGGAWSFLARLNRVSAKGSAPRVHRSTSIGFRCILNNP